MKVQFANETIVDTIAIGLSLKGRELAINIVIRRVSCVILKSQALLEPIGILRAKKGLLSREIEKILK